MNAILGHWHDTRDFGGHHSSCRRITEIRNSFICQYICLSIIEDFLSGFKDSENCLRYTLVNPEGTSAIDTTHEIKYGVRVQIKTIYGSAESITINVLS